MTYSVVPPASLPSAYVAVLRGYARPSGCRAIFAVEQADGEKIPARRDPVALAATARRDGRWSGAVITGPARRGVDPIAQPAGLASSDK